MPRKLFVLSLLIVLGYFLNTERTSFAETCLCERSYCLANSTCSSDPVNPYRWVRFFYSIPSPDTCTQCAYRPSYGSDYIYVNCSSCPNGDYGLDLHLVDGCVQSCGSNVPIDPGTGHGSGSCTDTDAAPPYSCDPEDYTSGTVRKYWSPYGDYSHYYPERNDELSIDYGASFEHHSPDDGIRCGYYAEEWTAGLMIPEGFRWVGANINEYSTLNYGFNIGARVVGVNGSGQNIYAPQGWIDEFGVARDLSATTSLGSTSDKRLGGYFQAGCYPIRAWYEIRQMTDTADWDNDGNFTEDPYRYDGYWTTNTNYNVGQVDIPNSSLLPCGCPIEESQNIAPKAVLNAPADGANLTAGTNVTFDAQVNDENDPDITPQWAASKIGIYGRPYNFYNSTWGNWFRILNGSTSPTNLSAVDCPNDSCRLQTPWNNIGGGIFQIAVNGHDASDNGTTPGGRCTGNPLVPDDWSTCNVGTDEVDDCTNDQDCAIVMADNAPTCNTTSAPVTDMSAPGQVMLAKFSATDINGNDVMYDFNLDAPAPATCTDPNYARFIDGVRYNPRLNIVARGTTSQGIYPTMLVVGTKMDGARETLCTININSASFASYTCNITQNFEYAMVELVFTNDQSDATGDRNLHIDRIDYYIDASNPTPALTLQAEDTLVVYDRAIYSSSYDGREMLNNNVPGEYSQYIVTSGGVTYAGMSWGGALRLPVMFTAPAAPGSSCRISMTPKVAPVTIEGTTFNLRSATTACSSVIFGSAAGRNVSGRIMLDSDGNCNLQQMSGTAQAVLPNPNPFIRFNYQPPAGALVEFTVSATDNTYASVSNPFSFPVGSTIVNVTPVLTINDPLSNYQLSCVEVNGTPITVTGGVTPVTLNHPLNADAVINFGYTPVGNDKWFTVVDGDIYTNELFDIELPETPNVASNYQKVVINRRSSGAPYSIGGHIFSGPATEQTIGSNTGVKYSEAVTVSSSDDRGLIYNINRGVTSYSTWVSDFDYLAPQHTFVNDSETNLSNLTANTVYNIDSLSTMQNILDTQTSFTVSGGGAALLYVNAVSSDILTFTQNLRKSGDTSGDLVIVTPAKVVIEPGVSTTTAALTLSAGGPTPNIQAVIVAKGGIEFTSITDSDSALRDQPIVVEGAFIAGASQTGPTRTSKSVKLDRSLGLTINQSFPSEVVIYDPNIIYNLTALDRSNDEVANFSGLTIFDTQFIYE